MLRDGNKDQIAEILQDQLVENLRRVNPFLALQLYMKGSLLEEAGEIANDALALMNDPRRRLSTNDIEESAIVFNELGRWQEFELAATRYFPPSYINEELGERAKRQRRLPKSRIK